METLPRPEMRLYNKRHERLYLNTAEFDRFVGVAKLAPLSQRRFALTLAYTGMRLSEARFLTWGNLQIEARVVAIPTLKQRQRQVVREVPIPLPLMPEFRGLPGADQTPIWDYNGEVIPRITAYRWIKRLMAEADISGAKACPKGLRHAFGTRAVLSGVPVHMLQRWLGHASMRTTAIYTTVVGPEQLALADRMWSD